VVDVPVEDWIVEDVTVLVTGVEVVVVAVAVAVRVCPVRSP